MRAPPHLLLEPQLRAHQPPQIAGNNLGRGADREVLKGPEA